MSSKPDPAPPGETIRKLTQYVRQLADSQMPPPPGGNAELDTLIADLSDLGGMVADARAERSYSRDFAEEISCQLSRSSIS